jgi:hypothetical protein
MPKGYWIASGQFSKGIGKLLVNAQKHLYPLGKCSHWLGVWKNQEMRRHPIKTRQIFSVDISKNVAISIFFFEGHIYVYYLFIQKVEGAVKTLSGSSPILLVPTIPL